MNGAGGRVPGVIWGNRYVDGRTVVEGGYMDGCTVEKGGCIGGWIAVEDGYPDVY